MARLTSELFVRLIDGVTKPAAGAARAIQGLSRAATNAKGITSFGQGLADAGGRAQARLDQVRGSMIDAVAAGYLLKRALTAPIQAAADFETVLEDMGQKAGIPREALSALGEQIKQVAIDTNQATTQIAAAVDQMLGMGATQDVALAAAAPIGQAATAYRAATADLANASYAAVENLKVPAGQVGSAIDAMAAAGKEGAFELRDMAQYFPALGAQYQALGQSGVSSVADLSAALQVVRKGTGDASSAATNLQNVMQKIYAPATIKAFADKGVDVFKEMERAAEAGLTPIEAIALLTEDTLNGDLSRMGQLFQDAQVQAGMRSLIQNMEEYRRIRDVAMDSEGIVSEDFARRIQTAQGAMDRWNAAIENLNISLGTALLPALSSIVENLTPIISGITEWTTANPELASGIVTAAAALIGFRVGLLALKWAGLFTMASTLTTLGGAFKGLGKAAGAAQSAIALQTALGKGTQLTGIQKFGTALKAVARTVPGLNLVGPALTALGAAVGSIGFVGVAVIAGIGAAGVLIWKYWDRLSSIFSGVGSAIVDMVAQIPGGDSALSFLSTIGRDIAADWEEAKAVMVSFGNWISGFFQQEVLTEEEKAAFAQQGREWAQGFADNAVAVVTAIPGFFIGLGQKILDAIGSIDLGKLVKIPDVGSMVAGAVGRGTPISAPVQGAGGNMIYPVGQAPGAEARASGGPVRRGSNYVVGDGGEPEFFTPGADGFITPFSEVDRQAAAARGQGGGKSIDFHPTLTIAGNVYGVDDLERRFQEFAAKMKADFDSVLNGSFGDTETT